jgi:hypothetical protein
MFQNVRKTQFFVDTKKREGMNMIRNRKLEREIIIKTAIDTEPPNWDYLAEIIANQILKGVQEDDSNREVQ